MQITFDPEKDIKNSEKHGVSLAAASRFEWDNAVTWPDQRREYGEQRIVGLGYIGDRLFSVVFVDRDENRRIISLRKANKREESIYAQT
ncbi:MAG: BrnT family toxin [Gallionella sp.]|nr:BrnT family toxin [Gallionella sp.]MDD4960429.1 BrnT family toxin [Gallionella sp.]